MWSLRPVVALSPELISFHDFDDGILYCLEILVGIQLVVAKLVEWA
jgi:hypothetical protein